MSNMLKNRACAFLSWLSQPGIVFYTLPLLMLLLVAGTIAQRYIGLFDAQHLYFSSFIFWLGPLPLPGGYTLTGLVSVSLLVKFLFFSQWNWRKAGINITHLGILVLLLGGLLTAITQREGFMVIPEGESSAFISDYHQRELVIAKDGAPVTSIPHQKIAAGKTLTPPGLPFTIEVLDACRNCEIIRRGEDNEGYLGMAQFMELKPAPPEDQEEANLYGATIALSGTGEDTDGTYVIFDLMPKPIELTINDEPYRIIYRKARRALPFSIRLEDFQKNMHPGTMTASAYSSDIIVEDNGVDWPVRIEMNKPLRYKGYTLFQSSFAENQGEEATVLAVVQNAGWLFPYLGTAIITIGLLMHTLIMAAARGGKREKRGKTQ